VPDDADVATRRAPGWPAVLVTTVGLLVTVAAMTLALRRNGAQPDAPAALVALGYVTLLAWPAVLFRTLGTRHWMRANFSPAGQVPVAYYGLLTLGVLLLIDVVVAIGLLLWALG